MINASGRPAHGRPLLLGITKASLSADSFISAASFRRRRAWPSDDELELERDIEYFVEPDEALTPRTGDLIYTHVLNRGALGVRSPGDQL